MNTRGPFRQLFEGQKRYRLDKGQVLVRPDEEPRGVFYIHKGYVKAYTISSLGEYQTIIISGPGEIFPLYWALSEEPRQLFYETMCPADVSMLPRDDFRHQISDNTVLLKGALAVLLQAFRYSHERIQNLALKTAHERVAYRLLFLAQHYGRREGDTILIIVPTTYQDLADSLNLTRETVNRTIREYISNKFIKRTSRGICVRDVAALKNILGGDVELDI